jgi:multidrug efflux pump subunit AcrB
MGNFVITLYGLFCLNKFVLIDVIQNFQEKQWPKVQVKYEKILEWCIQGTRPYFLLLSVIGLLFFSFWFVGVRKPNVVFFPESDPNFIFTYISLPVGTDQAYTDSITHVVEDRIIDVVKLDNPIVTSIISNVAIGAGDDSEPNVNATPHKGKVTVAFVEFSKRNGQSTRKYLDLIRDAVKGIPGAQITVEQEKGGPPTGKPINIELIGDNYDDLISESERLKKFILDLGIEGIEELKTDLVKNKPEIVVEVDKEKANAEGISIAQIGMDLRYAVFGKDVSKFRDANDEYDIEVRFTEEQRSNIESLLNTRITYRDMNMGGIIRQIPLSSITTVRYGDSFGGIKRKNQKRMITLYSNVLNGYNANEINETIRENIPDFSPVNGVIVQQTGEQEDQKETGVFLMTALVVSLMLIFFILVTQFNSVSKPILILSEILFSVIGVLLGFGLFKMDISIIMTGIGIVALAGIVVRNGILLVEFTDELMAKGYDLKHAIVQAGKIRMTPVLLTAASTTLGLIPLAIGLNIDFVTLFSEFNPKIFFGGDSVAFWGPLSWTMIFGLIFATFLTLVLVPMMYFINYKASRKIKGWFGVKVDG